MSAGSSYFSSLAELQAFVTEKEHDGIVITHLNMPDYAGMVLYIGIYFSTAKSLYLLNLEWMSLGLDLYGDTLQESYSYQFDSMASLTHYLHEKYGIQVTQILKEYTFDSDNFPNPITNADLKPEFEAAWERFQKDFRQEIFRDHAQQLYK